MEPILLRFTAALLALGCGAAFAQTTDSTAVRTDTTAMAAAPVSAPVPVSAAVVEPPKTDSSIAVAKPDSVVPSQDTVLPRRDSAISRPDTLLKPAQTTMKPIDSARCHRNGTWSLEGEIRYGWRAGDLLEEEDRLTRQFKVVLVDRSGDTSNVNPIASGPIYQAVLWYKGPCGNQFGAGFGYAMLDEHPASTYSASLSELFLEQFLVTARFRKIKKVSDRFNLFYEAAAGYNHSTIHGIPLVYANQYDPNIHLSASDLTYIGKLHEATAANGIHVEGLVGGEVRLGEKVGMAFKLGLNGDKIWRSSYFVAGSGATSVSNSADVYTWGLDLGLSVSRDF
ncbi:MAG: hypothetical protein RL173_3599 [Fibrobacterota bacterium]|jgi:hypothetical protein